MKDPYKEKILSAYLIDLKEPETIAAEYKVDVKIVEQVIKNVKRPNKSKGELNLGEVLRKIFPSAKIIDQHPIGNQFFDYYLDKLRVAFEYDGIQHYKKNSLFHGRSSVSSDYNFENEQYRDRNKEKLAKESFIYIIRIPYTEEITYENIRRIVNEHNTAIVDNLSAYTAANRINI